MRVVRNSNALTAVLSALPFLYVAPLAVAHQSKFLGTVATGTYLTGLLLPLAI